ncbi:MAG TPA: aminoacyl-tRNA hydrolase, partial [Candidatus Cloacimonas sp.]|nr:aminoacyl-tRNA hydrolase [Candidatus Cloacimonas sp.]
MKLIVGLGNPGRKYRNNRHNIGFQLLDEIKKKYSLTERRAKNYNYFIFKEAIFIKPKTYMNLSGQAVLAAMTKYKLDDILVCI